VARVAALKSSVVGAIPSGVRFVASSMQVREESRRPSLSVFFPAYNDGGTIASLVIRTVQIASQLTPDFEVIVVNDGSVDATRDIADELARTYPQVRAIHHGRNRGYGGALRTGFAAATKDLIAYTDGDAQYDPAELEVLWKRLTPDVDVVTGYKISRADPLHRVVIGRIYHHVVKVLFRLRVRDVDCDFRLIRREVFNRVKLERDTGVICLEMMRKIQDAGFQVVEVPVHHYHRAHGHSQFFNVRRVFWTAIDVLKLWVQLVVLGRGRQSAPVLFRNPTIGRAVPPDSVER
jgi:glycosyltransferase involved in cell wall biosynthesis